VIRKREKAESLRRKRKECLHSSCHREKIGGPESEGKKKVGRFFRNGEKKKTERAAPSSLRERFGRIFLREGGGDGKSFLFLTMRYKKGGERKKIG